MSLRSIELRLATRSIVLGATWAVALLPNMLVGMWWLTMMTKVENDISLAAISAPAAAILIGVYVAPRSIEKRMATFRPV